MQFTKFMLFGIFVSLIGFSSVCEAKIVKEKMKYKDGNVVLEGYFAYDDSIKGKRPGVLVVHEWMGLDDYAKMRAEMLAGLGYLAFAVDIYGKGVLAKDYKEASHLASLYKGDRRLMRKRAGSALEVLEDHKLYSGNAAAIGYCFGGTTVLELARGGFDLEGVVSFHGGLAPGQIKNKTINAEVLVYHGAMDPYAKPGVVEAFKKEMTDSGAKWQFTSFSGAVHGFTKKASGSDPSKGVAYNERADRRSWQGMQEFLKEIFNK